MSVAYNENDPFAAEWLRRLIVAGEIAYGDVLECSIEDLTPNDLRSYDQVHFFAGIGGWSLALRLAAVPDDFPVWTGSCPCQPFSAAGQGRGFDDERHLWPAQHWLIGECRPELVLGEQVAAKAGLGWWDLVSTDMEAAGYTVGAADLGAASCGAPHERQRLFWTAVSDTYRQPPLGVAVARAQSVPWTTQSCPPFVAHGFPRELVDGCARGFGNGLVPQVAAVFIEEALKCLP